MTVRVRNWMACGAMAAVMIAALLFLPGAAEGSSGVSPAASLVRLMTGLAVVVVVLLVVTRLLSRLNGISLVGGESFRVVAALPVGQKERVLLVQVGDAQMLIGVSAGSVNLLKTLDQPLSVRDRNTGSASAAPHRNWLQRVLAGGG